MPAKNTAAKGAGAKNTAAKGKKLGAVAGDEKVMFTLTPEFLVANPSYKDNGFAVGQQVEVFKSEIPEEVEESEDEGRSEEDEASMKAEPTGKFFVRTLGPNKYRLYNEHGQAVSPICTDNESIQRINKAAARANALAEARIIGPGKKQGPAPTVQ